LLTDTVGFFDCCIPLTNESIPPSADTLLKYYNYSVFDYITPPPPAKQVILTTSIFKPHNLVAVHKEPIAINRQSTDWIAILFLTCLFIFAWIQTSYSKRLTQLFRAVAQPYFVNQLEREGNLFRERITLGLGLTYYTMASLFIFLISREFVFIPTGISNLTYTSIVFIILVSYQMLKSVIIYASGNVFNSAEASRHYLLNILIFNHITGIILFPITIIAFYWSNTVLLIAGAITISLLLIYRMFRGFLTGLNNKSYNLFYLFLYLCTLEILPLLLLYKVISNF
jgi:hypothetical protein